MYIHVVIILTIVIKMVAIKCHIWVYDYVWTLVIRYPNHKNHILVSWDDSTWPQRHLGHHE
jgi:hypothetical protein